MAIPTQVICPGFCIFTKQVIFLFPNAFQGSPSFSPIYLKPALHQSFGKDLSKAWVAAVWFGNSVTGSLNPQISFFFHLGGIFFKKKIKNLSSPGMGMCAARGLGSGK